MAAARPSPTVPLQNLSESTENDSLTEEDDTARKRRVFPDLSRWNCRKIFTVIILLSAFFFANVAYSTIGAFFPIKAAEKGSTPVTTGVIISCAPLSVFLFSPVFGYYIPKLNLRCMFSLGLFFVGGAFVILGFTEALPSGWVFIVVCALLRSIEGTGTAMFLTALFSLLPQLYPNHMGIMTGLVEVGAGMGYTVGLPIGGLLFTVGGFKLPFLVVGGTCLAFIPVVFLQLQHISSVSTQRQQTPSLRNIAKLTCNFTVILLVISTVLAWAAIGFFLSTLAIYLTSQFLLSEFEVGLAFMAATVTYAISAIVVGRLCDKLKPRWFMISGLMIAGVAYFFVGPADFITEPILWLTIVAEGIAALGGAMGIVPFYTDLLGVVRSLDTREDQGSLTAVSAGITASALSFGRFIGPIIGGALTEMLDFQTSAAVFGEVLLAQGSLLLGATLINKICNYPRGGSET